MANWLSLDDALSQALAHVNALTTSETIDLITANNRIVASAVVAPIDVPPWDNSAMDGYAIKVSDTAHRQVTQTVYAGELSSTSVVPLECARIMTGAPIPDGADAVVIQENVERDGDAVNIQTMPNVGANIRRKASDIAQGDTLFPSGHCLKPQDLMLLSSLGLTQVSVVTQPKVALVATGNELAKPGSSRKPEQIFESHKAGLAAKLVALGCTVTDAGILRDNQSEITETFSQLSKDHDLVISSGGVSVGDADWVKPALSSLGTLHLWKVAIKPGKPFAFGQFGQCLFCGLPGNPVSAFVTFEQIVEPVIRQLRGETTNTPKLSLSATLTTPFKRRPGRKEFARGVFVQDENCSLSVSLLKKQSSAVMTSVTQANCYVVIEADQDSLAIGDTVIIQPF